MFRNFGGTGTQRFQKAREDVTGATAKKVSLSRRSPCRRSSCRFLRRVPSYARHRLARRTRRPSTHLLRRDAAEILVGARKIGVRLTAATGFCLTLAI